MEYKRVSPWAHIAKELSAEARKKADRDMQLALVFRGAQQEAYASWDAWDKAQDSQGEEPKEKEKEP